MKSSILPYNKKKIEEDMRRYTKQYHEWVKRNRLRTTIRAILAEANRAF